MTHFVSWKMLGEELKNAATRCVLRPVDASKCVNGWHAIRFFRVEFMRIKKLNPLKRDWPQSTYDLSQWQYVTCYSLQTSAIVVLDIWKIVGKLPRWDITPTRWVHKWTMANGSWSSSEMALRQCLCQDCSTVVLYAERMSSYRRLKMLKCSWICGRGLL